jgi:hypothetical protein
VNCLRESVFFALLLLQGCATIYTDSGQGVTLITTCANSTKVVNSQCTLTTPRGVQTVITPAAVELLRTDKKVIIECDSPETGKGRAELNSSENLKWAGNLTPYNLPWNLFGGAIVGIIVDSATGASSEFPTSLTISLSCPSADKSEALT